MELNFSSVETIPNLNASTAFQVDSGKVFKEDVDMVPTIIYKSLSYMPWRDLAIRLGRIPGDDGKRRVCTRSRKFAVLTRVPTPDSTYYPIPYYGSLFRGKWYNIKQLIGMAKEAKLKNNAPIKYQIEISNKEAWTYPETSCLRMRHGYARFLVHLSPDGHG